MCMGCNWAIMCVCVCVSDSEQWYTCSLGDGMVCMSPGGLFSRRPRMNSGLSSRWLLNLYSRRPRSSGLMSRATRSSRRSPGLVSRATCPSRRSPIFSCCWWTDPGRWFRRVCRRRVRSHFHRLRGLRFVIQELVDIQSAHVLCVKVEEKVNSIQNSFAALANHLPSFFCYFRLILQLREYTAFYTQDLSSNSQFLIGLKLVFFVQCLIIDAAQV